MPPCPLRFADLAEVFEGRQLLGALRVERKGLGEVHLETDVLSANLDSGYEFSLRRVLAISRIDFYASRISFTPIPHTHFFVAEKRPAALAFASSPVM